jgi:hypothetical protein
MVFATGNSGGSFQIAFGLAKFGLDSIFDMVILTGGPPISDLKSGVFGDKTDIKRWPNGLVGGLGLTDYLMGWTDEQYCKNRIAPDSIMNSLDTVSLVSKLSKRQYKYETFVNFVQSDDPTNAHNQARLYYDTIQSQKAWIYLDDVYEHAVPSNHQGASRIINLIVEFISSNTTNILNHTNNNLKIYPIPFNNKLIFQTDSKITEVKVFNMKGELITQSKLDRLDTSNWSSGVYIANISTLDGNNHIQMLTKE